MNQKDAVRNILFFLLVCVLIPVSATAVRAEEGSPPAEPGLQIGEGFVVTMPERASDSTVSAEGDDGLLPPGDDPGIMSWTTVLDEDFESGFGPGWEISGGFGITDYRSTSGSSSMYPSAIYYDPRSSYYPNNTWSWIRYGSMDFSGANEAYLEFRMWMDIEPVNDDLLICASTDGVNFYCYPYSGSTTGWEFFSIKFSDWPYYDFLGASDVWIQFMFDSNGTVNGPGVFIDDLVVRKTGSTAEPDGVMLSYLPTHVLYHPGDSFTSDYTIANLGLSDCSGYSVKEYLSTNASISIFDIEIKTTIFVSPILGPGDFHSVTSTPTIPVSTSPGLYYSGAIINCPSDNEGGNDTVVHLNRIEVVAPGGSGWIFEDNFESHDLTTWSRYNPGKTGLSVCAAGALNGDHGACFYRPAGNDKRRQLIDETPVHQTEFDVHFKFDINSLSMLDGERFRFMQTKMGAARPYFIVMKYQGGQYLIQLNTLLDDLTKVKTGWYVLPNTPQSFQIEWRASSAPGANDGVARLYLGGGLMEELTGLDNDTIYVDTFKIGYTSRLEGKSISGTFFVDDVVTRNGGYAPAP